jgi:1-acyl-sn-glycerol-3-phosphate acyltransferase
MEEQESLFLLPRELSKSVVKTLIEAIYDIEVTGQEFIPSTGGALIICNHTDNLDVLVQGVYCPRKIVYLAKAELFSPQEVLLEQLQDENSPFQKFPLNLTRPALEQMANLIGDQVSKQLRHLGGLPVIRDYNGVEHDKKAAMDYYTKLEDQMVDILKSGEMLSIYPEGTRTETGMMGPFKAMAAKVAIRAGVPVIPSGISGAWKMSSPKAFLSGKAFRAKINYNIGMPIQPSEFPQGPDKKAAKELTEIMEKQVYFLKDNPERRGKPRKVITKL